MKKILLPLGIALLLFSSLLVQGCGKDKGPDVDELLIGSWNRYHKNAHTVLVFKAQGGWDSDIRVEGAHSKIIEKRGKATGTWQLEGKQLVLTVVESDAADLWEKNKTLFCEIIELNEDLLSLQYPDGKVQDWDRSRSKRKPGEETEVLSRVIKVAPLVVNLNKIRSHDKDRYLCLDLEVNLKNLKPGQERPVLHPRARDAMNLFLSSLIYKDVKTFDAVKKVTKDLEVLLNPYLDNMLEDITVKHVVISSGMDKVDEFLIEHSPQPVAEIPEEDQET
ncbi:MAG: flagellar basal body-associated protein FliL [Desulfobacteraceae bacterium]|nr:flagellar basal body-associated protein FliL [Desulfobacteraceae bacterium]